MRLISCEICGVVIDQDRSYEPAIFDHDSGEIIEGNACWRQDTKSFEAFIQCPACDYKIFFKDGGKV